MKVKIYLLATVFFFAAQSLTAQTHFAEWVKTIETANHGNTNINNVLYDGTNVIVNGSYINGVSNFLGQELPGGIGSNGVIAKLTTEGERIWTTTLTGDNFGEFFDMALDSENNIILAGWNTSLDTVRVNGEPVITNNGQWLTFGMIMKLSGTDGSLMWIRVMTSTEYSYLNPTKVTIDENDEVFVTGYYGCPFVIDQIEFPYTYEWGDNFFFMKLNSEGTVLWGQHLAAEASGAYGAIRSIVSNNEALYCAFEYYTPYVVNGEPLPYTGQNYWLTLLKISKATGEILATNPFGTEGNQILHEIALDASGNLIAVGFFSTENPLVIGDMTLQGVGLDDGFILKSDHDLNFIWAKSMGGEYTDRAFNVQTDANDRIYIGGGFDCYTDFQYDGASVLPSRLPNSLSNFLVVTNTDGDFLNAAAVYGQGIESILSFNSSVVVSNRENVDLYCVGNFYDYVQFVEGQTLYGEHNVGYIYKWKIDVLTAVESADAATATFSVYPNPFNDFLHINLPGKSAKVELFNSLGAKVAAHEIHHSTTIDLRHLEAGSYFVRLASENLVQTVKLVKH